MNIAELKKTYELTKDDVWSLSRGGKDIWIITHDTIEKIAAKENINLDNIDIINSEWNFCRMLITMSKGDKKIITIGEALLNKGDVFEKKSKAIPIGNCESQYIGCMAEKRGVDRAVLKLIDAYQYGIFSEIESDDFRKNYKEKNEDEMPAKPFVNIKNEQLEEEKLKQKILDLARPYQKNMDKKEVDFFVNIKQKIDYNSYDGDLIETQKIIEAVKLRLKLESKPEIETNSDPDFDAMEKAFDNNELPRGVV